MAHAPPTPSSSGYSFASYGPTDYAFPPPANYGPMPHMDLPHSGGHYSTHPGHPHFTLNHRDSFCQMRTQRPPSPVTPHSHLPPSPKYSNAQRPPSPGRHSPERCSPEMKVMRQLCSSMAKIQSTMKEMAIRQEQIMDRMSLLEQKCSWPCG